MSGVKSFKDLIVWQKSMSFVTEIYNLTKEYPSDEKFGLINQIRRSSVSIPSNIAEGFGRNNTNEIIRFCRISLSSLYELQTQLEISKNIYIISMKQFSYFNNLGIEIEKLLKGFIRCSFKTWVTVECQYMGNTQLLIYKWFKIGESTTYALEGDM